jgi:hypothetical protein
MIGSLAPTTLGRLAAALGQDPARLTPAAHP